MEFRESTYHTQIYRKFKAIKLTAYREIVRFYEKEEEKILDLDFREFFELYVAYVNALFEIGAYRKHLLLIDTVIEYSITNNIESFQEEDLFQKMLFRKAASLFNTHQITQAEYILSELIKMDPENETAIQFYKKCRLKARPNLLNNARAGSVFLFMLAALVISLEVLFIRPWYNIYIELIMQVRNSIFLLGCLIMAAGFGYNYYKAEKDMQQFIAQALSTKKEKEQV